MTAATSTSLLLLTAPREEAALRAIFLLIPLLGGCLSFLSSDCSAHAVAWRRSLVKSRLSPPAPVTAVAWVVLYLCMGQASYLAYVKDDPRRVLSPSLIAYLTQCLLNHFFIIVLFGLQRIDLALLMIFPLWVGTGMTVVLFYDVCIEAAVLMLPVFAWVSLCCYLNLFLFLNNPVYTEVDIRQGYRPRTMQADKSKSS